MKVLRHVDTVPRQVSYRNGSLRVPHGWLLIYSGSSWERDTCVTRRNWLSKLIPTVPILQLTAPDLCHFAKISIDKQVVVKITSLAIFFQ